MRILTRNHFIYIVTVQKKIPDADAISRDRGEIKGITRGKLHRNVAIILV